MSKRAVDFYFDFMSPFAYLAFGKLPEICARYGLELCPHVVDLPKLKLLAGNTGPPNVTIPTKIRYLKTDLERWASLYDVPLVFPKSLDTGAINRAFFWAMDKGVGRAFIRLAWDEIWGKGGNPADPAMLVGIAKAFDFDVPALTRWVASDEAATRLQSSTEDAHEAGVFGTPIMVIGDQMWWGNDRLTFMEEALRKGIQN